MVTTFGIIVLAVVLVTFGSFGIGLAMRGRVQRRLYAGTGLEEWTTTARGLPWSERLHLARANDRGRATRPELASLGARRGRVMVASLERQSSSTYFRWILRLGIAVAVLQIALGVWVLTGDDASWINWVTLAVWPLALALYAAAPRLQRRQLVRMRRSVELNEALAAQQPEHTAPSP